MEVRDRERTGVLVVRVWLEGEPATLCARLTQTLDLSSPRPTTVVASGGDAIIAAVGDWLRAFEDSR